MKNRRRLLLSLLSLAAVAFIGGVMAYSTDRSIIESFFGLSTYRTVNTEVFTSPTDWDACQEIPKTITLKNESAIPVAARVKYEESWIASDHTTSLPLEKNSVRMANVKLHSPEKWIQKEDGYYYYYHLLEPGETTDSFLESVTLDCSANLGTDGLNECESLNGRTVCTTPENDYGRAIYTLRAVLDSLQGDVARSEWGYEEVTVGEATLLAGSVLADRIGENVKIVKVNELPENFPEDYRRDAPVDLGGLRLSTESSERPVYSWTKAEYLSWGGETSEAEYEDGTLYYYTEASKLYYSPNMNGFLSRSGNKLNDMSFYATIDASRITDLSSAFENLNRSDFSFLSGWNVVNVENMQSAFAGTALQDLSALSSWRLRSVKNMNSAFSGDLYLRSLDGAQSWFVDGSVVENLGAMFQGDTSIEDVAALSGWRLPGARSMRAMFSGCSSIGNAAILEGWGDYLSQNIEKDDLFTNVPAPYPTWY